MARWTGTWLSGGDAAVGATDDWRGRRLGLPPEGPGAIATTGSRIAAFMIDILVSGMIGALINAFVVSPEASYRALAGNTVFAVEVLVLTAVTGQSLGMRVLGIRVIRLADRDAAPGFLAAALRTALLMLLIPALIFDRDARGLHDKAAGTVVVRTQDARPFAD